MTSYKTTVTTVPVVAAQDIAERYCQTQVIVVTWDGESQHCCTFGITVQDADLAALAGDRIKQALGWPQETMGHLPPRVQALQEQIRDLIEAGQAVVDDWDIDVPNYTPNVERLRDAINKAQ